MSFMSALGTDKGMAKKGNYIDSQKSYLYFAEKRCAQEHFQTERSLKPMVLKAFI